MISTSVVLGALDAVERAGLDYIVVGALATNAYSFARATKDADFVLGARMDAIEVIAPFLPPDFTIDPQPRMELSTGTFRWIVKIEQTDFMVEFFHLSSDPHHQEEFARKRRIYLSTYDRHLWIATAEDLIIQKCRWARPKDLEDAFNIMLIQGERLDFPYLERWCETHATLPRLQELQTRVAQMLAHIAAAG